MPFYGVRVLKAVAGLSSEKVVRERNGFKWHYSLRGEDRIGVNGTVNELVSQGLLSFDDELKVTEKGLEALR